MSRLSPALPAYYLLSALTSTNQDDFKLAAAFRSIMPRFSRHTFGVLGPLITLLALGGSSSLIWGCSSEDLASETGGASAIANTGANTNTGGASGTAQAGTDRGGTATTSAGGGNTGGVLGSRVSEPARVDYPSGPYGRGIGATISNLSFLGFRAPTQAGYDLSKLEVVRLSDFYNPGGSRNDVKVIVLNSSAVWCSVCRAEYQRLQASDIYAKYRSAGIEMVGLLFEDQDANPAQPSDLVLWGRDILVPRYKAVEFPLLLDPGFKSGVYFTSDATPMNMLIDAHTMQILNITMGFDVSGADDYFERLLEWTQR
ncbi:MAG TPA: hypothetical protein VFQ61_11050 [Polyangiaceae bacterium]|nr:hypothetical protein [Polyangiaceae bacterium]